MKYKGLGWLAIATLKLTFTFLVGILPSKSIAMASQPFQNVISDASLEHETEATFRRRNFVAKIEHSITEWFFDSYMYFSTKQIVFHPWPSTKKTMIIHHETIKLPHKSTDSDFAYVISERFFPPGDQRGCRELYLPGLNLLLINLKLLINHRFKFTIFSNEKKYSYLYIYWFCYIYLFSTLFLLRKYNLC